MKSRLRRLDESANITVYEKGDYNSYANCGLPFFIGGVIPKDGAEIRKLYSWNNESDMLINN